MNSSTGFVKKTKRFHEDGIITKVNINLEKGRKEERKDQGSFSTWLKYFKYVEDDKKKVEELQEELQEEQTSLYRYIHFPFVDNRLELSLCSSCS
ncbi:hypothetical protein M0802_006223 [Mischocyttarus mexicanus]|nr:hypothetical protein M0802_006223 [Mischocyttarus mexicanus]